MFSSRAHIERSGVFLLAVLLCGVLAAPFGHDLSHIRSLEHVHGEAAEAPPGRSGAMSADFLVEERTAPHFFSCDLCAFRSPAVLVSDQLQAPRLPVRMAPFAFGSAPFVPPFFHDSIRAPPAWS